MLTNRHPTPTNNHLIPTHQLTQIVTLHQPTLTNRHPTPTNNHLIPTSQLTQIVTLHQPTLTNRQPIPIHHQTTPNRHQTTPTHQLIQIATLRQLITRPLAPTQPNLLKLVLQLVAMYPQVNPVYQSTVVRW